MVLLSWAAGIGAPEMIFPTPPDWSPILLFPIDLFRKDFIRFSFKLRTTAITEKAYGCIFPASTTGRWCRYGEDTDKRQSPQMCHLHRLNLHLRCIPNEESLLPPVADTCVFTEPVEPLTVSVRLLPSRSKQICFLSNCYHNRQHAWVASCIPLSPETTPHSGAIFFLPLLFFIDSINRLTHRYAFIQIKWKRLQPSLLIHRFYRWTWHWNLWFLLEPLSLIDIFSEEQAKAEKGITFQEHRLPKFPEYLPAEHENYRAEVFYSVPSDSYCP